MRIDDEQLHPNVGSISFQYAHKTPSGSIERREFYIKAGDNPDFWLAERLMPGAEKGGCIGAVFGDELEDASFEVEVRSGSSVFKTRIFADTPEELAGALSSIGGGLMLGWPGSPALSRWDQIKLVCRWYWERRPVIRRRSPLEIFD